MTPMKRKRFLLLLLAAALLWPSLAPASRTGPSLPEVSSVDVTSPGNEVVIGESLQLLVQAAFVDGSQRDVTSDAGTRYSASPQGIVSIQPGGLVQAVSSGTVTLVVTHEQGGEIAAADFISILVHPAGDRDGDGLPDDYETQYQLDPAFGGDA